MPKYISFPRVEGTASRQAHADLPKGTYERELGKEGFYGPSTQMYHRHPPTGWTSWHGPLRPRAFDLTKLSPPTGTEPWSAPDILSNASLRFRSWTLPKSMTELARNADGDELLFVRTTAAAICTATMVTLRSQSATMSSFRAARCGASRVRRR